MTYEGSTTHPGCWESTVWIILNKPIYITKQEVSGLMDAYLVIFKHSCRQFQIYLIFFSFYFFKTI